MADTTNTAVEELWAATRDASWYSRPNIRHANVLHLAGKPGREGRLSRCGRSVLDSTNPWEPAEVPVRLRCRSNGCRQAWPTTSTRGVSS